jgi:hypothetical protein
VGGQCCAAAVRGGTWHHVRGTLPHGLWFWVSFGQTRLRLCYMLMFGFPEGERICSIECQVTLWGWRDGIGPPPQASLQADAASAPVVWLQWPSEGC